MCVCVCGLNMGNPKFGNYNLLLRHTHMPYSATQLANPTIQIIFYFHHGLNPYLDLFGQFKGTNTGTDPHKDTILKHMM